MIASTGPTLLPEFLPVVIRQEGVEDKSQTTPTTAVAEGIWVSIEQFVQNAMEAGERDIYRRALQLFDAMVLNEVMHKTEGNQSVAAEILGISRPTLRHKLRNLTAERTAP